MKVGEPLPDSVLLSEAGPVHLRERIGKTLVVYFYPKDQTFGCTRQACAFRDQYADFAAAGAEVIGISRDDQTSHAAFKEHHQLPFTLLTDPDGAVAAAWHVKGMMGTAGRVTFVFDRAGVCRHRFESQILFGQHVDEALVIVRRLASDSPVGG